MKKRVVVLLVVIAGALTITGSALAFDCIRVSSSPQGLQQSTRSGNWLAFDMTPSGGGVAQILDFFGMSATPDQLACLQSAYTASGAPTYFALGVGVAGGKTGNGPGVLAQNAPDNVLSNGTGIDHFEDSVAPALLAAADNCGIAA